MSNLSKYRNLILAGLLILPLLVAGSVNQSDARSNNRAGQFDYYALVLSWSPTYCASRRHGKRNKQCNGGRPYSFVMHGLWPQYTRGYPQNCRMKNKPWVSRKIISEMLDIMPSSRLIIHEYKKHGTCTGMTAKAYYAKARAIFNKVKIPARYQNPAKTILVSPKEIENDFLKANPDMNKNMISVSCGKRGRLRELRICFSKKGDLKSCGVNESQHRLCRRPKIALPPVRNMARPITVPL